MLVVARASEQGYQWMKGMLISNGIGLGRTLSFITYMHLLVALIEETVLYNFFRVDF